MVLRVNPGREGPRGHLGEGQHPLTSASFSISPVPRRRSQLCSLSSVPRGVRPASSPSLAPPHYHPSPSSAAQEACCGLGSPATA